MWKALRDLSLRMLGAAVRTGTKILSLSDAFGGLLARGLEISKFDSYADFLRVGSKNVWATFKALDLCGKVVMDTPWKLTRKTGNGEPVTTSQVGALLNNPNPFQTLSEMLYLFVFHLKLTGNAYWAKDQANLAGDRPKALFPLNPKRMQLVIDGKEGVTGYIYHLNGEQIPFDFNEVMHFKNPHPDNDHYGLGDIEAAQDLFGDFINRQTWAKQFWKNGASPSGILILKGDNPYADKSQFDQAQMEWQRKYGGSANSGKTAWLTGNWDYHQLGMTALEMQNLESVKLSVESIFQLHGVPLSVAGIRASANFATARVEDLAFRRYTIKPMLKILVDTMQIDLVKGFDPNLVLQFDIAGLIDLDLITTSYLPLFDRGVFSVNEIRQSVGYAKIDDPLFDQHFLNAGLVPFELAGITQPEPVTGQANAIIQDFLRRSLEGGKRLNLTGGGFTGGSHGPPTE